MLYFPTQFLHDQYHYCEVLLANSYMKDMAYKLNSVVFYRKKFYVKTYKDDKLRQEGFIWKEVSDKEIQHPTGY